MLSTASKYFVILRDLQDTSLVLSQDFPRKKLVGNFQISILTIYLFTYLQPHWRRFGFVKDCFLNWTLFILGKGAAAHNKPDFYGPDVELFIFIVKGQGPRSENIKEQNRTWEERKIHVGLTQNNHVGERRGLDYHSWSRNNKPLVNLFRVWRDCCR